ncbi:MAG: heavy-metal-associated domain-containing protein [Bacteroidales bacterium]|jgi:copper chaperone CopZ|nr:heavy-metal-associated domain-containing protein [Bacteroidales bacterium]
MKKILKFLLLSGVIVLLNFSVNAQEVKTENIKMKVEFHCGHGKKALETKLKEVKGIESFVVDFETKTIDFNYDPESINKDGIVEAVENIGYYTEFSDRTKQLKSSCSHH